MRIVSVLILLVVSFPFRFCHHPPLLSLSLNFFTISLGDKRPCERCGDKKPCRDGKRKKAKYLEGTEDKDLIPNQEKEQEEQERARALNRYSGGLFAGPGFPFARPPPGFPYANPPPSAPGLPSFAPNNPYLQMTTQPYVNHGMPTGQQRAFSYAPQRTSMGDFSHGLPPASQLPEPMPNPFADSYPDLDIEQMGFGNRYGAAELNVLNDMSSGLDRLVGTPTSDTMGSFDAPESINYGIMPPGYGSSPTDAQQWRFPQPGSSQGAIAYDFGLQDQDPFDGFLKQEDHAGTLLSGSLQGQSSYPSPVSGPKSGPSPQGTMAGFEGNPAMRESSTNMNTSNQTQELLGMAQPHQRPVETETSMSKTSAPATSTTTAPTPLTQPTSSRRKVHPSTVYKMVTEPYSYTKAFHDLMALIRKRFSQKRTAHIAKALASIRPSFISSLIKLNDDDRIFMEKCLQRTLLDFEEILGLCGTPTILCRRTGEVVAVSDGFSILTGWRKAVLLGKEPNLNVNTGGDAVAPSETGASTSRGTNTPYIPDTSTNDDSRLKPVSIVDLLDDESVCDFFDDYAHLAFGDSRGQATRACKFLRYSTAKDKGFDRNLDSEVGSRLKRQRDDKRPEKRGDEDDTVECMICWSVKRDVFDIPMLFVISVLPVMS